MNLLILSYEMDGFPAGRTARQLAQRGHDVLIAQLDTTCFVHRLGPLDYYDEAGLEYLTLADEYEELHANPDAVDWDWIKDFERTYCTDLSFQQLMMSDPMLSRWHHYRDPYYTPIEDADLRYAWAGRAARWVMGLIEDFDPDAVLSVTRRYFCKNVVGTVARRTNLPMFTLVHSRVGDYWFVGEGLATAQDHSLLSQAHSEGLSETSLKLSRSTIERFCTGETTALYPSRSQRISTGTDVISAFGSLYEWLQKLSYLGKRALRPDGKARYRGFPVTQNHFDSHTPSQIRFFTNQLYRRLRHLVRSPLSTDVPSTDFVYFPLHTLPESSTLTLSREYHEADVIRHIVERLPAGVALAVKENPNMVGDRPRSFYSQFDRLPGVHLIHPQVDSRTLLTKSNGVAGISGTALLEGAVLGKPTHAFGLPEFAEILTTHGRSLSDEFLEKVRDSENGGSSKGVEEFLGAIFEYGREIPRDTLFGSPPPPDDPDPLGDELAQMFTDRLHAKP